MELTLDQALQKGIEAHRAGNVQEADRYYTAILKANPKHPDANHNMGVLAVVVGKVETALPFFKTALEANPKVAQFWLSYIDALIKLERTDEARAEFDKAKSKGAKGDDFDKLEQRLKEADQEPVKVSQVTAEATPTLPNILDTLKLDQAISLAKKKAKEGDPEEAKRIYQDILIKFPKNKRASDGLKGLTDKTIREASKGQNPPQDQLQSLANLYNQGQLQQALKQAETLVQQFPQSAILFSILGAVLNGLGQLDAAIEAYNKVLAIKPDFAEAYNNMGIALKVQGKLEEAIEAYNKALAIKPDYAEAYNNMGNALQEQGKLEEAIEAYNKVLAIKPDYADAYNNMGVTLKEKGKLEEAIEAYNKVLAIKPDFAEAYNNMGVTLKEKGKLEEAIEAYNKAVSIKPDYADAFYNMGVTLKEKGKLEEAIEAYNKALAIKPDYGSAKHMLSALTGNTDETAPREYVENLFDGYSKNFEASLVDTLEYKIPKLIRDIIIKSNRNGSLGSVLDLGCGTGLFGVEIKDHCSQLEGIDLSNKMLEIAKYKNIYDKLSQSDIVEYLSSKPLDFDYFIATDVFVYIGNLTEIFRLIKSRNKQPAQLVFSTEHTELDGYHILKSGRYSHSKTYIESLCKKFDYNVAHFSTADLRKEKGHFLTGGIYILNF